MIEEAQIEKAQAQLMKLEQKLNLTELGLVQDCTDEHIELLKQMIRTLRKSIENEITQVVPPSQKHHFVPKFYLEAWGDASKPRMIHLYNIPKGIEAHGPWRNQCQRSNYYGHMERSVVGMSDNRSSKVIGKIRRACQIPKRQTYNDASFLDLIQFVVMQHVRVPAQADDTKRTVEESLAWAWAWASHIKADGGPSDVTFEQPMPQLVSIKYGMVAMKYMDDLQAHLIVSDTDAFLTSDNPVFFYNQYNQDLPGSVASVDSHGFQAFCPLSPKIVLVLYDGNTYELTDTVDKRELRSMATKSDVTQLNKMQAMNATECLYASTSGVMQTAPYLIHDVQHIRSADDVQVSTNKNLHVRESVMHTIGLDLSFFRIKWSADTRAEWWRLRTHRHDTPDVKSGYGWQKALYEYSITGGEGELQPPPGWNLMQDSK